MGRPCMMPEGMFGMLSDDLMLNILENIHDRIDRQAWCLVCKRFLQVEALTRKKVNLLRAEVLDKVLRRYQYVEELNLSACAEVDDDILDTVGALSGRHLRSLTLARLSRFTAVGLRKLLGQCPGLTELDLSFCEQIDDSGMFPIARLEKLKSLKLVNCRNVTDVGLGFVALGCFSLRHLSLKFCGGVTDCSISLVALHCKLLESLDLSSTHVTAEGLATITNLAHLRKLYLSDCKSVDDASLECLRNCSSSLLMLDVAKCQNVSNRGIRALARGPVRLQELSLSYCLPITDGLLSILEKFEYLQVIRLDGCEITSSELASIGKGCKSLKEFSLSKCKGVTDEGIRAVVEGCGDLHELDLTCCHDLTDLAVASIGRFCRRLLSLKMEACVLVTLQGFAEFGHGLAFLQFADLTDCNIVDEGLKWLSYCTALKILKLGYCPKVSDVGIGYIGASCKNLLEIDLYRSVGIGDSSVAALCNGCPRLSVMNLSYCARVTDVGLGYVAQLEYLTNLEMRKLPLVTSAGLSAVASGCKRLVLLDFKHCTIGDSGVLSIAMGCPNLRQVNMGFSNVTVVGVKAIADLSCMQNMKIMHMPRITEDGLRKALADNRNLRKVSSSVMWCQSDECTQKFQVRSHKIRWIA